MFQIILQDIPFKWSCWSSEREKNYSMQEQEETLKAEKKYLRLFYVSLWFLNMKYETLKSF